MEIERAAWVLVTKQGKIILSTIRPTKAEAELEMSIHDEQTGVTARRVTLKVIDQ